MTVGLASDILEIISFLLVTKELYGRERLAILSDKINEVKRSTPVLKIINLPFTLIMKLLRADDKYIFNIILFVGAIRFMNYFKMESGFNPIVDLIICASVAGLLSLGLVEFYRFIRQRVQLKAMEIRFDGVMLLLGTIVFFLSKLIKYF